MSFMITAIVGIGIAATAATAKLGMALAGRKGRIAEQKKAKREMAEMKSEYENLDTSNLSAGFKNAYAGLENTMEDLTVNQQQAQFQAQQGQQSRANIMQGLQGAAGGSGIAGLAQAMANQGQLQAQKSSASIGLQEAQNQKMAAQQAARNQQLEAGGEMNAQQQRLSGAERGRGLEWNKTSTLLGMSQQRLAQANLARAQAKQQQMNAIGDIGQTGMQLASVAGGGVGGGVGGGGQTARQAGVTNSSGGLTPQAQSYYQQGANPVQMDPIQNPLYNMDPINVDPNQISGNFSNSSSYRW
tara:strand:- start:7981 stop:8880 length:900 start_codon:yes stop_codon:yes gene_type:complete